MHALWLVNQLWLIVPVKKRRSGTFKTRESRAGPVRVPLFWKSHCVFCVPELFIPYEKGLFFYSAIFNQVSKKQNQSYYIGQPQRTQTIPWTNETPNQKHVTSSEQRKTAALWELVLYLDITELKRWWWRPPGQRLEKLKLYFNFELRNCLDLFSAPIGLKICSS